MQWRVRMISNRTSTMTQSRPLKRNISERSASKHELLFRRVSHCARDRKTEAATRRQAIQCVARVALQTDWRCSMNNKLFEEMLAAMKRAKEDMMNIQEDCNSGEFELDPQFAIDRLSAAIADAEKKAKQ